MDKKKKFTQLKIIIIITSPINNFPYVALEAKSYVSHLNHVKGDIKEIIKNNKDGYLKFTDSTGDMIKLIYNYRHNI